MFNDVVLTRTSTALPLMSLAKTAATRRGAISMRAPGKILAVLFTCSLTFVSAQAAPTYFTPGNLAVLRCGDGTQTLVHSGNTVSIDQYRTNGTLVNSTNIPDSGLHALILSGVAGSEGGLTRSMDATTLAFTGYNTNLDSITTTALSGSAAKVIPRGVATLDAFGNYNLVQTTPSFFSKSNPRYAATDGTNDFWVVGGVSGVVYFNPPSYSLQINDSVDDNRALKIFGGNLYFSTQKGSPVGLYTFTSTPGAYTPAGLPTAIDVGTNLLIATGEDSSPEGFALNPSGTVAYIADSGGNVGDTEGGGIQKWVSNGSTWNWAYTFSVADASQPPGAFAVAVDFSGENPVIYATTVETNAISGGNIAGNHLVRIIDTNSSAAVTYLAQAGANEVFKGVDFAPSLLPQILVQPQGQTVTNETPGVSFAVSATSPFTLNYQWEKNGAKVANSANISGATTATLTFEKVAAANEGSYTVIITNQYGAVTSSVAALAIEAATAPGITTQPGSQTNLIGGTAAFTVVATGVPAPVYQWSEISAGVTNTLADGPGPFGETFSGSTNATLLIINVQTNDAGDYYVTVSNAAGSKNSQVAVLTVLPVPPEISTQPTGQTNLAGQTISFSVNASGTSPNFQWTFNGAPLSDGLGPFGEIFEGSLTSSLEIENAQTNDSGSYAVIVTNAAGTTTSQSAVLSIVVLPPPSFISYSIPGSIYAQDFNSLPSWGTNYTETGKAYNPVTIDGVTYSFGTADPFDFAAPILSETNLSGGLGLADTMPGWYGWVQDTTPPKASEASPSFLRFGANCGDQGRAGIQSFGPTNSYAASTNRALGLLSSGSKHGASSGDDAVTARFINNTPLTLTRMSLQFTGELWRQSNLPKTLSFFYVLDLTGTNGFDSNPDDYVNLPDLDVAFPTNAADVGGTNVDGTLPINQVTNAVVNQTITDWPPGAALWLIWEYADETSGAQGIGIDNLTFSATAGTSVTVSAPNLGSAVFISGGVGAGLDFSFTNTPDASFTVWSTTNLTLPFGQWQNLGPPTETPPGTYEFNDPQATNFPQRFYRVTSP
jgi:hypothetical protein